MRALILAAGLGTRLRPLTSDTPKPLVPALGRPLVEYVLEQLARHGFAEALINVHYLPDKMNAFVENWNLRGGIPFLRVQDESAEILDSGGAIALGAEWLFADEDTALICNTDLLNPDLLAFAREHRRLAAEGVLCSLLVTPHAEAGTKYTGLRVENGRILSFEKLSAPDPSLFIFPGMYLLEKTALERMPKAGAKFSVLDLWRGLAAEGKLGAWVYRGPFLDIGTPADLAATEEALRKKKL